MAEAEHIYSVSDDQELHKIDPDGNKVWEYTEHSDGVNEAVVDSDEYVYSVSEDNEVHKIDSDGNNVWKYTEHTKSVNSVAVDLDSNVYSVSDDEELHKIDSDGNNVWKYTEHSDSVYGVAVDSDGYLYSSGGDSEVHKIDPDGNNVWKYTEQSSTIFGVDVDKNGNVYSVGWNDEVHKIDSDGNNVWKYTEHSDGIYKVKVDQDGYVYSGSYDNEVHKIDSDGDNVWKYTEHLGGIYGVAVDSNGYVYSSGGDSEVHKIDSDGDNVWKYTEHSDRVNGVEVLSYPNETLVITTDDASNVKAESAQLNGTLYSLEGNSEMDVYFEWGTDDSYGNTTDTQTLSDTGSFNDIIDGLSLETEYHYRAVATDGTDTWKGDDISFETYISPYDFSNIKKLDVESVSDNPTISRTVPIKITSGDDSTTGTGEIVLDWTNISSESDIGVYDKNDELLDYYFESFNITAETAVIWVYRDWVRDGSTQAKVAYGDGLEDQSVSSETVFNEETDLKAGYLLNDITDDLLDVTSNDNDGEQNGKPDLFFEDSVSSWDTNSHQGITYDGEYYYTTDTNHIYKWDEDGSLIDENTDPTSDIEASVDHLGDLDIYNGKLYIPVEQWTNCSDFSNQVIAVFTASDLSYDKEYDISSQGHEVSGVNIDAENDEVLVTDYCASEMHFYNFSDFTHKEDVEYSETLNNVQGGVKYKDKYLIQEDSEKETYIVDRDGTVHKAAYSQYDGSDAYEGITTKDQQVIFIVSEGGASGYIHFLNCAGIVNGGLSFDGDDDYINCGDDSSLKPTSNITVYAWFKSSDSSSYQRIVSMDSGTTSYNGYCIRNDEGEAQIQLSTTDDRIDVDEGYCGDADDDEWHLLVMTYDGSTAKGYLDGSEEFSESISGDIDYTDVTNLNLGARQESNNYYSGCIDNVAVYDEVLSSDEITTFYDSTKSSPDFFNQQEGEVTKPTANSNKDSNLISESTVSNNKESILEAQSTYSSTRDNKLTGVTTNVVDTDDASNVKAESAQLNGTLNDLTGEDSLDVYFEYGTDDSYGNTTDTQTISDTGSFNNTIENLSLGTEYHYRAVATDGTDIWYGDDVNFETRVTPYDFSNIKKLDVAEVSDNPTVSRAVPIKITSGDDSTTGTGKIVLDWTDISSKEDIAVYDEGDNLLDYYFESFDDSDERAIIWVYRDWDRDGSTQAQLAYGNGLDEQSVSSSTVFDKETDLEAGFLFNETSGDLLDVTSNNIDGSVEGATQGEDGIVDGAYNFDGDDDYVDLQDETDLEFDSEFTIAAWIYWDGGNSGDWSMCLTKYRKEDDTDGGYYFGKTNNDEFKLHVSGKGAYNEDFTSDSWNYIVGVWDGSEIRIYQNDSLKDSTSEPTSPLSTDQAVRIGDAVNKSEPFSGKIDNLMVYNEALTSSDDRTALYDATKSSPDFFSQQEGESTELTATDNKDSSLISEEIISSDKDTNLEGEDSVNSSREALTDAESKAISNKGSTLRGVDTISSNKTSKIISEYTSQSSKYSTLEALLRLENSRENTLSGIDKQQSHRISTLTGVLSDEDSKGSTLKGKNTEESSRKTELASDLENDSSRASSLFSINTEKSSRASRLYTPGAYSSEKTSTLKGQSEKISYRLSSLEGEDTDSSSRTTRLLAPQEPIIRKRGPIYTSKDDRFSKRGPKYTEKITADEDLYWKDSSRKSTLKGE